MRVLFIFIIALQLISARFSAQTKTIDSLQSLLKTQKEDTNKVLILMHLSNLSMNNTDVMAYAQKALFLAGKLKYKHGLADALNNIGYVYDLTGEGTKAIEYYNQSLELRKVLKDTAEIANAMGNIGGVYENLGDIPRALDCYLKSLKLRERIKDEQGIAVIINNIGSLYYNQDNYPKALEYFLRSLELKKKIGQKDGIATSLNNIAGVYHVQGDYKKALEYYLQSLALNKEIGFKEGMGFTLNNLGYVYERQHDFKKAFEYYDESLKVRNGNNDKRGTAITLNNIAGLKLKEKNYKEAIEYARRSFELAKQIGFPAEIGNAAETFYHIYKVQKKGMEALEMHELFIRMRDSVNNNQNKKLAVQKQMQYAFEKKEAIAKAEQEKKESEHKAELKQQTIQRNGLIGGFALMLGIAILFYRNYRNKRKTAEIIEKQKMLVETKQKEIIDSIHYAKRIQQSLMPSDKYFDKILKKLKK